MTVKPALGVGLVLRCVASTQAGEDGTFHTNPKRKRGLVLPPRLRFGLVSASTACGIARMNPSQIPLETSP